MEAIKDHSGLSSIPISIFEPKEISELKSYLRTNSCNKYRIGAGLSGVSGGAVPDQNEVFISLKKLNKISWFDKESGILVVEAGVTMSQIQQFTNESDWFFPVIPGSLKKATIGGMIACNGGGPFSLKYGKIENFVLGLDVLTAKGQSIQVGGYATKITQGINSKGIWIGSEGTLGFICNVILKCVTPLRKLAYSRIATDKFSNVLKLVPKLLKFNPYLLEVAEKNALRFSSKANEHVLWIATDRELPANMDKTYRVTTHDKSILDERFSIGQNLQKYKPFIDLDVSFPLRYVNDAIIALKKLLVKSEIENIVFGHGGDGNYHIHIFQNNYGLNWENIQVEFDEIVSNYFGQISGEHGIGKVHKARFKKMLNNGDKKIYQSLKKALDADSQLPSLI